MNFIKIDTTYFEQLKRLQLAYKASIGEDTPTNENFKSLYKAISDGKIYFYGCVHNGELIACCSVFLHTQRLTMLCRAYLRISILFPNTDIKDLPASWLSTHMMKVISSHLP